MTLESNTTKKIKKNDFAEYTWCSFIQVILEFI